MIKGLGLVLAVVAALIGGRVWRFHDGVYYGQCDQATRAHPPADLNVPDIVVRATDWLDATIGLDHPGFPACLRDGTCGD